MKFAVNVKLNLFVPIALIPTRCFQALAGSQAD